MTDPALTAALERLRKNAYWRPDSRPGSRRTLDEHDPESRDADLALVEQALEDAAAPWFRITEHDGMFLITGPGGLRALLPPPAPTGGQQ